MSYYTGDKDSSGMALHGTIGEFNSALEDWASYAERMDSYLAANEITDAGKRRAVLLSTCGPSTYRLIRSLVAPNKPTDKSYADLVKIVGLHFNPKPSVAVQRFKFNSWSKQPGETVSAFVAELR